MEKKKGKRVKKDLNDFGEGASSSGNAQEINKDGTPVSLNPGPPQEDGAGAGAGAGTGHQEQEEASMQDLPEEMVRKILKDVNTRSLIKFRLVNKQGRLFASEILCQRRDLRLSFAFENGGFLSSPIKNVRRSLKDFLKCMENSKNCPFARFTFSASFASSESTPSEFFEHKDWQEFFSNLHNTVFDGNADADANVDESTKPANDRLKRKIKSLELVFSGLDNIKLIKDLVDKLSDLLLTKIPNVQELFLNFDGSVKAPRTKLFPPSKYPKKNSAPVPGSNQNQRPALKVVKFSSPMFSKYPRIVTDLLNAAVNLKKIHLYFKFSDFTIEMFQILNSVQKLELLQEGVIQITPQFLSAIRHIQKPTPAQFKLKVLYLTLDLSQQNSRIFCREAANFLSKLLESSKNTLKGLTMPPLGFLHSADPPLQFPILQNLEALRLFHEDVEGADYSQSPFFHPGVRSLEIFPTVRSLELDIRDWSGAFPTEDSTPCLPNAKTVRVNDTGVPANRNSVLLLCPNAPATPAEGAELL